LSLPPSPNGHSVGGIDRPSPEREGKHVVTSFPRKSRISPNLSDAGTCLPSRCLRRSDRGSPRGRRSGRTPRLPDRLPVTHDDRQQPQWPSRARTHAPPSRPRRIIVAPNLAAHPEKRRTRVGRPAHRQGSTPRYRAGHHPLPGASTGVEAPLYRTGPGRALTSGNRRLPPASKHHPPSAQRSTTPNATTARGPGRPRSKPHLARSHRGV
jgi:hypothetical protein